MDKIIRKALLVGVGALAYSKEKAAKMINDLLKENKITEKAGKKIVDEMMVEVDKYKKTHHNDIKKLVHNVVKDLGLVTKAELEKLKAELKIKKVAVKTKSTAKK